MRTELISKNLVVTNCSGMGELWRTDLEHEEIVWELCELNFHFKLLALDSRMTMTPESNRQVLVS
jgi:hypothetical protein